MWARENEVGDDEPLFFSRQRTADDRRKAIDRVRAWQLVKAASERADVRVLALRATGWQNDSKSTGPGCEPSPTAWSDDQASVHLVSHPPGGPGWISRALAPATSLCAPKHRAVSGPIQLCWINCR